MIELKPEIRKINATIIATSTGCTTTKRGKKFQLTIIEAKYHDDTLNEEQTCTFTAYTNSYAQDFFVLGREYILKVKDVSYIVSAAPADADEIDSPDQCEPSPPEEQRFMPDFDVYDPIQEINSTRTAAQTAICRLEEFYPSETEIIYNLKTSIEAQNRLQRSFMRHPEILLPYTEGGISTT